MLRTLPLVLVFSVAPWSEPPAPPPPRPVVPIIRVPHAPPSPAQPARHAPGARSAEIPRRPTTRLIELKTREMAIWKGLMARKTPAGFYQLGSIRLDIANEQRRLKLINASQYRHYLQHKAVAPLKLLLREWAHRARASDGVPYDQKAWSLLSKIMTVVKMSMKNPPLSSGQRLVRGRVTHYGGEKIYGNEPYPEFHGKPTAVGDTFCMFGQTCAYMRAPLNSWVRVRNPRTGRFVDLRVNDTGPFEANGTVMDLSRGAYRALGLADGDRVLIRRIPSREVVNEPMLCSGRGHAARSPRHLAEKHFSVPRSWR